MKLGEALEKVSVSIVAAIGRGRKIALGFLPRGWGGKQLADGFERKIYPKLNWSNAAGHENELIWDNDGRHFSKAWLELESKKQLRPIRPWPSNSLDLNPIENLFAKMKTYVERATPTSEESLKTAIRTAWRMIQEEFTKQLMDSMPKRLSLCIRNKGDRTKY